MSDGDTVAGTAPISPIYPFASLPYHPSTAAFIWTPAAGTQNLNSVIAASDWYFEMASDVSDNWGNVFGRGAHLDAATNAWFLGLYRLDMTSGQVTAIASPDTFSESVNSSGDAVVVDPNGHGSLLDGSSGQS